MAVCLAMPADASNPASALRKRLLKLEKRGIMIGHQDDPFYGTTWKWDRGRSDVKEVCGDWPAVMGFELGNLELDSARNLDGVPFDRMREEIRNQYERGGICTISWHPTNPTTGKNAWDPSGRPVEKILRPMTAENEIFDLWLNRVAKFLLSLKTGDGKPIPVIFRPWHEMSGGWFWWGKDFCTPQQYIALWKLTAERFKECGVTNALFAYSPDRTESAEAYMERYPGDEMVDIFGLDCYCFGNNEPATFENYVENVKRQLTYICRLAKEHGKVAAFTETGYEGLPYERWWTEALAPAIADLPVAYVLTWRNAHDKVGHFYAPYPGHSSVDDFTAFYNLPRTLFVHDVNGLYLQNSK